MTDLIWFPGLNALHLDPTLTISREDTQLFTLYLSGELKMRIVSPVSFNLACVPPGKVGCCHGHGGSSVQRYSG